MFLSLPRVLTFLSVFIIFKGKIKYLMNRRVSNIPFWSNLGVCLEDFAIETKIFRCKNCEIND